jgi:glycosyltransferase involved in cell wall biosynthesis
MTPQPAPIGIAGGIVAHNEEARIERAVRSLLDQALPTGCVWTEIRVLASGCTDRTGERVRTAFANEPLVHLEEEGHRAGKAAALAKLFRGVTDPWFVLLDGDCRAEEGSLAAMLAAAGKTPRRPVAVGARHVPPALPGGYGAAIALAWEILNERAAASRPDAPGPVLLDNLVLLSTDPLPRVRAGVINEARVIEAEVLRAGGAVLFASDARVAIAVPSGYRGLIAFRRRILNGHRQLAPGLGPARTLVGPELARHPGRSIAAVLAAARRRHVGLAGLAGLAAAESTAQLRSRIDGASRFDAEARWTRLASTREAEPA